MVKCDKCGQTQPQPSRNHQTCNRHIASEPTGYCQGTLHPVGQMSGTTWTAPPAGKKEIGYESR